MFVHVHVHVVLSFIQTELNGPNCNCGYRTMWSLLRSKYGITIKRSVCEIHVHDNCTRWYSIIMFYNNYVHVYTCVHVFFSACDHRDVVHQLLQVLDPEGVLCRKQRRLKRRIYLNKVCTTHCAIIFHLHFSHACCG